MALYDERLAGLDLTVEGYETVRHEQLRVERLHAGDHRDRAARRRPRGPRRRRDLRRARPRRLPGASSAWARPARSRVPAPALVAAAVPREPARPASREYRRWAFESAALDLALRQAGLSLGEALGLPYRPVRFVVSTRLDIRPWLALYPEPAVQARPHGRLGRRPDRRAWPRTGSVRIVDFKAYYAGRHVGRPARRAPCTAPGWPRFPTRSSKTPPPTAAPPALVRAAARRLSWDAPIHSLGRRRGAAPARRTT